jgi:hypothetical protein
LKFHSQPQTYPLNHPSLRRPYIFASLIHPRNSPLLSSPLLSFIPIHIIQWPHPPRQRPLPRSTQSSKRSLPAPQRNLPVSIFTPDSPWLAPSAVQLPTEVSHLSMCKYNFPIVSAIPVPNHVGGAITKYLTDIASSQRQDKNTTRSRHI